MGEKTPPSQYGRLWTSEEQARFDKLLERHGHNWERIAYELGRSPQAVKKRYEVVHYEVGRGQRGLAVDLERLRRLVPAYTDRKTGKIDWVKVQAAMSVSRDLEYLKELWNSQEEMRFGRFTTEEIEKLFKLVEEDGLTDWEAIAKEIPGRYPSQLKGAYDYHRLRRKEQKSASSPFTAEEEEALIQAVAEHGLHDFGLIRQAVQSKRSRTELYDYYRQTLAPKVEYTRWPAIERRQVYEMAQRYSGDVAEAKRRLKSNRDLREMEKCYQEMCREKEISST